MYRKRALVFSAIVLLLILILVYFRLDENLTGEIVTNKSSGEMLSPTPQPTASQVELETAPRTKVIAGNLEIPWDLVFLPDKTIIVTERIGRLRRIDEVGSISDLKLSDAQEVFPTGEGGLLGIELHPDYEDNSLIYLYFTYEEDGKVVNKVNRYVFKDNELTKDMGILDNIPGAARHDGGRIKFGPDGYLYITTGDAGETSLSQDNKSLAGKILRVDADGAIPPGNPYNNAVYSLGHRNPQGIAWDIEGRLWEVEHGSSATDELNIIERGGNYGWPIIRGDEGRDGMIRPVLNSGSSTWAPSGADYLNGSIFFAGLRGRTLYEAKIKEGKVNLVKHLENEFGRLRTVVVGPDGFLYLTTSNRDGRGVPVGDDDRIIKVNPAKL